MKLFFTQSVHHLVEKISLTKGLFTIKQFSDGELYVKIEEAIPKEVWVIASTAPPAENILEMFFLLDALMHAGAQKINLFIPYFGYARQAIALPGEAHSAQCIAEILKKFQLHKTSVMQIHASTVMHSFFSFTNIVDMTFFCNVAKSYDVVAAPDKGVAAFAQEVATMCDKEVVLLRKTRPSHEQVIIEAVHGIVDGKKVLLVDDMISTGRTLIEACNALKNLGAYEVSAAATHGVFAPGAHERLQDSLLNKIYVTNTLLNVSKDKIDVYDISGFIESTLRS